MEESNAKDLTMMKMLVQVQKQTFSTIDYCIVFLFKWMEDGLNGNLLDLATQMESNKEPEPVQTQHH